MKIYTKTGDKGNTSLIGGKRVPKHNMRIEAYGTVDELISWVGLLRDCEIDKTSKASLAEIQERLMTAASFLATDSLDIMNNLPQLFEEDIEFLEKEIDNMEKNLEPLQAFILPGGHKYVSYCHITRTICRRAERLSIKLSIKDRVNPQVIRYLNRLSDYLFVLSRKLSKDLNAKEIEWKPRLKS